MSRYGYLRTPTQARIQRANLHVHASFISLLSVALLMAHSVCFAGDLNTVIVFNIPATTLDKALLEFGAQVHMQLSFAPTSITAGLMAPELKGRYTGREALARLLQGTQLKYLARRQTIEILPEIPSTTHAVLRTSSGAPPFRKPSRDQVVADPIMDHEAAKDSKTNSGTLREVIVTGSRIRTTSEEGPQEVQIYDSQQIDQSGQTSVADFVSTLPSVAVTSVGTAFGVGATVTLRGLPDGTTLVLLDGRRLESGGLALWESGANAFDLNNIPIGAVKRIEIDESGASAIYGSDAIAGVVNIILRKDFNGFEINGKYSWAKDFGTVRTNLAWGRQWQSAGISVIGSYGIDGGFLNSQRLLSSTNDYTSFGGPDNNYPICFPGNVFSTTGAPLPGGPAGSEATYAAITGSSVNGKPPLSQFAYGSLNTCSLIAGRSILPSTHRAAILVLGHLDISPTMDVFTEIMYSHLDQVDKSGYPYLFGLPSYQQYTVPATNPYNPFGTSVGVAEVLQQFPSNQVFTTNFFRPLAGIRGELPRDWHWEVSAWESTDWSEDFLSNLIPNSNAIQDGLNSSDPTNALNPFVAGSFAPQGVGEALFSNGDIKWMSEDRSAEAFLAGPLVKLPAGNLETVVGGDYVRSEFDTNDVNDGVDPPNTRLNYARTYYAVFAESRVPLLARGGDSHTNSILALTVAGRHDQYSRVGGANTDQFGFEFRPVRELLVRGTYAEAFQAPPLPDLYGPQSQAQSVVEDPTTGEQTPVDLVSGGNTGLRPMTGHSQTGGFVYSSSVIKGLTLAVTQWHIVESNAIQSLAAQDIVDYAADFPGRVVRNSAGVIVEVDDTTANFGSIDTAGLDYELDYRRLVGSGVLSANINAVETYHYREALEPGAPVIEAAGVAQDSQDWAPRWKGTASVGYTRGPMSLHLAGRYTGSYLDYDSLRTIGNFWIADANARFDLPPWFKVNGASKVNAYVAVGASNLFNRAPQFSNYLYDFYGYDAAQMSIVGRTLYVETGAQW